MRERASVADTCVVLAAEDLECAGPEPRTTPRPRDLRERVTVRRRGDLPGVEHWRVESSTRLWAVYHERYAFCVAHWSAGPQAWKYRRCTYGMQVTTSTMLIAPGEVHVTTRVPLSSFQVLMIEPILVDRELDEPDRTICRRFSGGQTDQPEVARRFSSLCQAVERDVDAFTRRAVLREFLFASFSVDHEQPRETMSGCERAVKRVRDILHSCSAEKLTLELFEQETNVSKYHLERSFRAKVGVPIHRYLKLVRLERAQELLRRGHSAVVTAGVTGFFDAAHLNHAFKSELGITPGGYGRASG